MKSELEEFNEKIDRFANRLRNVYKYESLKYLYVLKDDINAFIDSVIKEKVDEETAEIQSRLENYDASLESHIEQLRIDGKAEKARLQKRLEELQK